MELIIFVGLQASGKTTAYHNLFEKTHALVSKDKMSRRAGKEGRQAKALDELLSKGHNVVVDNCSVQPSERASIVSIGRKLDAAIACYYFESTLEACLERNAKREGKAKIDPFAIIKKSKLLVPPSLDEGFDLLFKVVLLDGRFVISRVREPINKDWYSVGTVTNREV